LRIWGTKNELQKTNLPTFAVMKHLLNLADWNRREHFEFFSRFEEPFFGLVANIDCTPALAEAKRLGVPFFLYYLYHALQAVNQVEALRYRIEDGQVYTYDRIHASATIGRPDHTFGFSFIELHNDLGAFVQAATAEIAAVQASQGLRPQLYAPRQHAQNFGGPNLHRRGGHAHARVGKRAPRPGRWLPRRAVPRRVSAAAKLIDYQRYRLNS
jgi:chloramphenicol O-acetyltransferase type A